MRHILDLGPDIIKLDMSLTRHIENDASRRALAESLIGFAARTEAKLLAEEIETPSELQALKKLGVQYGQGYYLSRPMPLIKLSQFILGARGEDSAQPYPPERMRRSASQELKAYTEAPRFPPPSMGSGRGTADVSDSKDVRMAAASAAWRDRTRAARQAATSAASSVAA